MPFTRATLTELIDIIKADLAADLGENGVLAPNSYLEILGKALAGVTHSIHGHIDWASRQLFPDQADDEYLERWAAIFGIERLKATIASGLVEVTGNVGTEIPVGTEFRPQDVDILYSSSARVIISGEVTIPVEAANAGSSGNVDGETGLSFVTPITGVDKVVRLPREGITGGDSTTKATGNVIVTMFQPVTIPVGTAFQTTGGTEFLSTAVGMQTTGTGKIPILAKKAGVIGNIPLGSKLTLVQPLSSVNNIATVIQEAIVSGVDEESLESLRQRVLSRIRQPPHGGAAHDYIAWAKEIPGVRNAWVIKDDTAANRIHVVLSAPGRQSPAVLLRAQSYIGKRRPVTADVVVRFPDVRQVNVTVAISPDTPEVRTAIRASLLTFFEEEVELGGKIYVSKISEAISIAAGETYHKLTVPTANVSLNTFQLPTLGRVTFSAATT